MPVTPSGIRVPAVDYPFGFRPGVCNPWSWMEDSNLRPHDLPCSHSFSDAPAWIIRRVLGASRVQSHAPYSPAKESNPHPLITGQPHCHCASWAFPRFTHRGVAAGRFLGPADMVSFTLSDELGALSPDTRTRLDGYGIGGNRTRASGKSRPIWYLPQRLIRPVEYSLQRTSQVTMSFYPELRFQVPRESGRIRTDSA